LKKYLFIKPIDSLSYHSFLTVAFDIMGQYFTVICQNFDIASMCSDTKRSDAKRSDAKRSDTNRSNIASMCSDTNRSDIASMYTKPSISVYPEDAQFAFYLDIITLFLLRTCSKQYCAIADYVLRRLLVFLGKEYYKRTFTSTMPIKDVLFILHNMISESGLYISGGHHKNRPSNAKDIVSKFVLNTNTFTISPYVPMLIDRVGHYCIYLKGYIYYIGGSFIYNRTTYRTIEVHDLLTRESRILETVLLPENLFSFEVVTIGDKIYIVGGYVGNIVNAVVANTIYEFDPVQLTITLLSTRLPFIHIRRCSTVEYNGLLYITGYNNNELLIFNIFTGESIIDNSIDFYNAVLVKSGNDLYSFGHSGGYFCKYIRPNEWQVHITSYIYVSYGFSQVFCIDSRFIRLSRNTFDCFLDDGTYAPNTIVGPCNLGKNGIRLDDLKNDPKDQDNTDFGSTMVLVEKKQLHYNHL